MFITTLSRVFQNGPYIKPEPEEQRIAPLAQSASWQSAPDVKPLVKPEPVDSTRLVSQTAPLHHTSGRRADLEFPVALHVRVASRGSQQCAWHYSQRRSLWGGQA